MTHTINDTELELISQWEENIDDDESWDIGHSLLIEIKPEFVEEAKKNIDDLIEDEGTYYLSECPPSWWMDVEDGTLETWAIEFFECEIEWVADVSVSG